MANAAYLLSDRVATGFPDERLADVALRISRANAHHLVVIHESNKAFLGLIKLADIAAHRDPGNRILGDLISRTPPVVVGVKESAQVIAEMFEQHRLGEAIVTDHGAYVGIITAESVLQWNRQQRNRTAQTPSLENTPLGSTDRQSPASYIPRSSRGAFWKSETPKTVLLVEDHAESRRALSLILNHRHFRVIEADSIRAALVLFGQHEFALVISDIGLPDGTGFELMTQLRRKSNIKAISMTAFSDQRYSAESLAAGFNFHFTKPLDTQKLDAAFQNIFGADSEVAMFPG